MMHRIFFAFIWIIGRVLLWIYRVDVKGLENLPKHSVLLCPNHSTDLDPVLIGLCLPLDYHLHFMAKAELFDNRALAWLIRTLGAFPVQRDGKDIQSIKTAMQVLHKGENLLIFPEGTTIRGGVGYHDGLPAHAHAGIAMIGVRTGATLVPVFCDGQKKPFRKTRIIFGEPYVPEVTGRRGTFGALGHGVTDVDTGQLLPLDHGSIMDASVKAVKKGERASPGELKGDFDLTRDSGTLYANTECGIFGKLSAEDAAKITGAALPIAKKDEIKTGRATILATVSGNETREYDIEIEKIYSLSGSTRNLLLRVTDGELLAQTGGVVQGMSGSAILQDGKIIGAVTHVLLDDPSRGYGIFIENMLSAAGLSSE